MNINKPGSKNNIKNSAIIYSVIVIAIIAAAFLAECLIFNGHSIFNETGSVSFDLESGSSDIEIENAEILVPLGKEEIEQLEVQRQNDKIIAELNGAEYVETVDESLIDNNGVLSRRVYKTNIELTLPNDFYVKKLKVEYPSAARLGYGITLIDDGRETKSLYDSLNERLGVSVTNVSGKADKLIITLSTSNEFTGKGVKVEASNFFSLNYCRIIYLIAGMLIIFMLIVNKRFFAERLEIAFVICALVFGGFIILYDGTNQMSWDEHIHYESAYRASFGQTIRMTEAAIQMKGMVTPSYDTIEEKAMLEKYTQERNDFEKADIKYQQRFVQYNVRAYLPQSLMLAAARILKLPFAWSYMLGKLGNLLFYTLILAIAIRVSKIGKIYIAMLGLMPTPLFLACSYAYDAFVTALVFLGFVVWLNEILDKESKLKWYNALIMLASFVVGCWSKVIYMAMMLLLCFIPRKKFDSRLKSIVFKLCTVIIVAFMLYTIVSPPVSADANYEIQSDFQYFGDKRVADTSFDGQIKYVLSNPVTYTGILLKSMGETFFDYTFGRSVWLLYGYLGRLPRVFAFITFALIMFAALIQPAEDRRYILETRWKLLIGIMGFGMACLIWTGLYLTFTAVGADYINGVQGRYYIPFLLPLMFIFKNNKIKNKISTELFNKIIFGAVIFINLYGTYVYLLKPLCF